MIYDMVYITVSIDRDHEDKLHEIQSFLSDKYNIPHITRSNTVRCIISEYYEQNKLGKKEKE